MTSPRPPRLGVPDLGVGVGLRSVHYQSILDEQPRVDWFECISENFFVAGGRALYHLDRVRERYPVVLHGVSLNLGGPDALDADHLGRLVALTRRVSPPWVSDHLCWSGGGGVHVGDLLPLPFTDESAALVIERVKRVQGALGVRFAIENVSSYLSYRSDEMPEWEFLARVAEGADCGILLDVNNVYVSSRNHGLDAEAYIDGVPEGRVLQMHLAGHLDKGRYLLDTHSEPVCDEVWALYRRAAARLGACSTLIEWDDDIPPLPRLLAEADRARALRREAIGDGVAA